MPVSVSVMLRRYLVCAAAVIICLCGCRKEGSSVDDSATCEIAESSPETVAEPGVKRLEYANDLERLSQLTDRLNRACGGSYAVVLGGDDSGIPGGLISVGYALFDRLSDDGAAVMIAEAMAAAGSGSALRMQTQTGSREAILQTDEVVGRYIARAGFGSEGFIEWLNVKKALSIAAVRADDVPDRARITAFMHGYSSTRYSKEDVSPVSY